MDNLSNDTKKLIKIISKYYSNLEIDKITENKFYMKLYNDIKKNLKKININDIIIKKIDDKPTKYLKDNDFTSNNIKNNIIEKLTHSYECIHENNIIIYFCKSKINNNPIILIHMFQIIKMLKILFKRVFMSQKIIYFETLEKKRFPDKISELGPNEVNSGLTFLNFHKNGEIILYRKEEILKVLIHELIHSNLIDKQIVFSNQIKKFSNNFCVDYSILLNEAFTETYALIINLFYIHITCKFKKSYLNTMFENEIKYSNYICSKIVNYYNIEKMSDVIKNNNLCKTNFPQKTNVFSYYFLKNILIKNHMKLGPILSKNSINYKLNNESAIEEIILLIMGTISSLDENNTILKKDLNKSLRLCLYEIKF